MGDFRIITSFFPHICPFTHADAEGEPGPDALAHVAQRPLGLSGRENNSRGEAIFSLLPFLHSCCIFVDRFIADMTDLPFFFTSFKKCCCQNSSPDPPPFLLLLLFCGSEKTVNPWLNYNLTFHPDFTPTGFCLTLQDQSPSLSLSLSLWSSLLPFCLQYFPFQL